MTGKFMTIDNIPIELTGEEKNLLEVIRRTGIELPTFCYYSELSVYGACRMCMVEDDRGNILRIPRREYGSLPRLRQAHGGVRLRGLRPVRRRLPHRRYRHKKGHRAAMGRPCG